MHLKNYSIATMGWITKRCEPAQLCWFFFLYDLKVWLNIIKGQKTISWDSGGI